MKLFLFLSAVSVVAAAAAEASGSAPIRCAVSHCEPQVKKIAHPAEFLTCFEKCLFNNGGNKLACLKSCGAGMEAAVKDLVSCTMAHRCFTSQMLTIVEFEALDYSFADPDPSARPFVTLHGLGDACANSGMKQLTQQMANQASTYGVCIEYGAGGTTFTTNMESQIKAACEAIKADSKLDGGFNIVGLSQGNAVARGIIESCDMKGAVYNYVSLGGPHQGTSAMPQCTHGAFCKLVNYFIGMGVYTSLAQDHIAPANYYKDPAKMDDYMKKCTWLPHNNNEEATKNASFKKKFSALNKLVLVKFLADTVLSPPETEWFGFWGDKDKKTITTHDNTALYKEDWIGLKTLDERKAVDFVAQPGQHLNITQELVAKTVVPALRNSLSLSLLPLPLPTTVVTAAAALLIEGQICKSTSDGLTFEVDHADLCPVNTRCLSTRSPMSFVIGGPETFVCSKSNNVNFFPFAVAATPLYEDPNTTGSCQKGEVDVQIQGIKGKVCSPQCSASGACPTDVPAGVTAKPTCALQGMGGKYCALVCSPSTEYKSLRAGDAQCGKSASCKAISGTGICTYDS